MGIRDFAQQVGIARSAINDIDDLGSAWAVLAECRHHLGGLSDNDNLFGLGMQRRKFQGKQQQDLHGTLQRAGDGHSRTPHSALDAAIRPGLQRGSGDAGRRVAALAGELGGEPMYGFNSATHGDEPTRHRGRVQLSVRQ